MTDNVIRHAFQSMRTDLQGGGEPPDNVDMEARVTKLESTAQEVRDRLVRIETKMDQFATKEDMALLRGDTKAAIAEAKNSIIMWVVSAIIFAQVLPSLLKKFGL